MINVSVDIYSVVSVVGEAWKKSVNSCNHLRWFYRPTEIGIPPIILKRSQVFSQWHCECLDVHCECLDVHHILAWNSKTVILAWDGNLIWVFFKFIILQRLVESKYYTDLDVLYKFSQLTLSICLFIIIGNLVNSSIRIDNVSYNASSSASRVHAPKAQYSGLGVFAFS